MTEVKAKYGKGKSASISVDTSGTTSGNSLSIKVNAPQLEKMKKLEITVNSKVKLSRYLHLSYWPKPNARSRSVRKKQVCCGLNKNLEVKSINLTLEII